MRDALMLSLVLAGLALFIAGDVTWLIARQRRRPIDLRVTGTLIAAGVGLVIAATLIRIA